MLSKIIAAATLVITSSHALADWPQFLGPTRNGIALDTGLARQWPPSGPPVLWRIELGAGFGGAAIRDGQIYMLDRIIDQRDALRVIDLESGQEKWRFEYEATGRTSYHGSRSTPAIDEQFVYTVGVFGHVYCIDHRTRQPVWTKHLVEDLGASNPKFGFSQSPLLYGDLVILTPLSDQAGVVALEKKTGNIRWQTAALGNPAYTSPLMATIEGVDQIMVLGKPDIVGIDVNSGQILWRYAGFQCRAPIPSPTPVGNGRFFITGGYNAGSMMIQIRKHGGRFEAHEDFRIPQYGAHIANPLFIKGLLFANCTTRRNKDGLVCIGLGGEINWLTGPMNHFDMGNMIGADGLIFLIHGKMGTLHLIEPNATSLCQLASAKLLDGEQIWAPLAMSDGKLVIRDQHQMKCVDVRAK